MKIFEYFRSELIVAESDYGGSIDIHNASFSWLDQIPHGADGMTCYVVREVIQFNGLFCMCKNISLFEGSIMF
jgi:hypothetical protein